MRRSVFCIPAALAVAVLLCVPAGGAEENASGSEEYTLAPDNPDYQAMPNAPGKDEVFAFCSACHSMKLVTQQHLSRKRWDELLDWMVDKQGMAPLPDEDRKLVLDYLAEHYGSKTGGGSPTE